MSRLRVRTKRELPELQIFQVSVGVPGDLVYFFFGQGLFSDREARKGLARGAPLRR